MRKLCLLVFVGSLSAQNGYYVHNLVSDLAGMADHVDPNLINPWGNGFSSGSPFWIGNNGTGTSTLYEDDGTAIPLVVKIPAAAGATTPGKVTGVIFNGNANAFEISGQTPSFIFCSEDGVISAWSSKVNMTNAQVLWITPRPEPNIKVALWAAPRPRRCFMRRITATARWWPGT